MKNKKATATHSRSWVIDTDESGGDPELHGPFKSQKAAEDWIKEHTLELYEDSCECLRRMDWDQPMIVLQEVARYRPEIQHTMKIRLREDSENDLHELPPPCGSECNQGATGG